ncbi:zinc-binding metallopeptidase family protein [Pareuzebyella sediminis]|uniref:zinc-binding metallopeptidase family protein n=1 Tax=Pareuzebyella sediminis TaxID=2607998 RepID=UPI0011EE4C77|nr:putative zinc-binding peptidase [Pareuzebyella sediminis]
MKIFHCQNCNNPLYFENTQCLVCGTLLGYKEDSLQLISITTSDNGYTFFSPDGTIYKYCKNHQYDVCNWLLKTDATSQFCTACSLNRTIPNLSDANNLKEWRKLELAKHRLVYGLLRLSLPLIDKEAAPHEGLAFDFLSENSNTTDKKPVRTGHMNGLITINVAEADSVHREYMRKEMAEPYRTLIGHFRHEVGHYYWERLISGQDETLEGFRGLFGDERSDYGQALHQHYQNGAPANWNQHFISKYAASHPWEDWAETWAHYLHLVDMLETAFYFSLETGANFLSSPLKMKADFDPYQEPNFEVILKAFRPLTYAINSLNRSMGQQDIYPFVIPDPVIEKLRFVHQLVHGQKM